MTAKFVEVTILAVNKEGVVDKATVEIEHAMCGDNHEHIDESYATLMKINLFNTYSFKPFYDVIFFSRLAIFDQITIS